MHATLTADSDSPVQARRFHHRQAFELHVHDGRALALRQRLQQLAQVAPGLRGLAVAAGKQLLRIVQRRQARPLPRASAASR